MSGRHGPTRFNCLSAMALREFEIANCRQIRHQKLPFRATPLAPPETTSPISDRSPLDAKTAVGRSSCVLERSCPPSRKPRRGKSSLGRDSSDPPRTIRAIVPRTRSSQPRASLTGDFSFAGHGCAGGSFLSWSMDTREIPLDEGPSGCCRRSFARKCFFIAIDAQRESRDAVMRV